jgi:hypothetical protein
MVDIPSFSAEFRNRAPESSGPTGELRSTAPRRRCFHRDPVTMVARSAVGYRLHIRLNSGNTLFNVFNVFMSLPGHSPWWRKTSKLTDGCVNWNLSWWPSHFRASPSYSRHVKRKGRHFIMATNGNKTSAQIDHNRHTKLCLRLLVDACF